MIEEQRENERLQLENKYVRRGIQLQEAFQRKKDQIEQQLGLIYEKKKEVESGRTRDIELHPVETFVVDTEKQQ